MTWKIKAVAGPFVGQEIIIDQDRILGRDKSVDIVLQGGHVSRRHAELSVRDNNLWIKDLKSSNGTLVNGVRIDEQQLHENDEFQIDVVRFLVLNTLNESLREKTTETIAMTEEGRPSHISIPKPAPMPPVQAAADPAPPQAQADLSVSRPAAKSGIKNTLPAALAMAILILLIIIGIWYFVA
jgi:pSer/pThr/pTyr-binding forkhead associated (FHA) protein